jgi:hypothetical protein
LNSTHFIDQLTTQTVFRASGSMIYGGYQAQNGQNGLDNGQQAQIGKFDSILPFKNQSDTVLGWNMINSRFDLVGNGNNHWIGMDSSIFGPKYNSFGANVQNNVRRNNNSQISSQINSPFNSPFKQTHHETSPATSSVYFNPTEFTTSPALITPFAVLDLLHIFASKEHPKRITIIANDGFEFFFVLKREKKGDMKKDMYVMTLVSVLNNIIQSPPQFTSTHMRNNSINSGNFNDNDQIDYDLEEAKHAGFTNLPTFFTPHPIPNSLSTKPTTPPLNHYLVCPLCPQTAILEWLPNTTALKTIYDNYLKYTNALSHDFLSRPLLGGWARDVDEGLMAKLTVPPNALSLFKTLQSRTELGLNPQPPNQPNGRKDDDKERIFNDVNTFYSFEKQCPIYSTLFNYLTRWDISKVPTQKRLAEFSVMNSDLNARGFSSHRRKFEQIQNQQHNIMVQQHNQQNKPPPPPPQPNDEWFINHQNEDDLRMFQILNRLVIERKQMRIDKYLLNLRHSPQSLLTIFFTSSTKTPSHWATVLCNYRYTYISWSVVGYLLGLGDRHTENVMIQSQNGAVSHVDFDCVYDKGRNLPVPEVVPFRATPNLLNGLGSMGIELLIYNSMLLLRMLQQSHLILYPIFESLFRLIQPSIHLIHAATALTTWATTPEDSVVIDQYSSSQQTAQQNNTPGKDQHLLFMQSFLHSPRRQMEDQYTPSFYGSRSPRAFQPGSNNPYQRQQHQHPQFNAKSPLNPLTTPAPIVRDDLPRRLMETIQNYQRQFEAILPLKHKFTGHVQLLAKVDLIHYSTVHDYLYYLYQMSPELDKDFLYKMKLNGLSGILLEMAESYNFVENNNHFNGGENNGINLTKINQNITQKLLKKQIGFVPKTLPYPIFTITNVTQSLLSKFLSNNNHNNSNHNNNNNPKNNNRVGIVDVIRHTILHIFSAQNFDNNFNDFSQNNQIGPQNSNNNTNLTNSDRNNRMIRPPVFVHAQLLVNEATDFENLSSMFLGWMPHL